MRLHHVDDHANDEPTRNAAADFEDAIRRSSLWTRVEEIYTRLGDDPFRLLDLETRPRPGFERVGGDLLGDWRSVGGLLFADGPTPRGFHAFRRFAGFMARLAIEPPDARTALPPPLPAQPRPDDPDPRAPPFRRRSTHDRLDRFLATYLATRPGATEILNGPLAALLAGLDGNMLEHLALILVASPCPRAIDRDTVPDSKLDKETGADGTHPLCAYVDGLGLEEAELDEILDPDYFRFGEGYPPLDGLPRQTPWRPGLRTFLLKGFPDPVEAAAALAWARERGYRPATPSETIGFAWTYPVPAWHGHKYAEHREARGQRADRWDIFTANDEPVTAVTGIDAEPWYQERAPRIRRLLLTRD